MKLKLEVLRQDNADANARWERFTVDDLDESMSILEVLDRLNERLVSAGRDAVTFESD